MALLLKLTDAIVFFLTIGKQGMHDAYIIQKQPTKDAQKLN